MLFHEAFGELGVEPGATPDEIRRAYLRLVKQHTPERDPARFARVREAYELARRVQVVRVKAPSEELEPPSFDASVSDASSEPTPLLNDETPPNAQPAPHASDEAPKSEPTIADLIAQQSWKSASLRMIAEIDAALGEMRSPAFPVQLAVPVALELIAAGAFRSGRDLYEALLRQSEALGGDIHLFPQLFAPWVVLREIQDHGQELSKALRRAVARATLMPDRRQAIRVLGPLDDAEKIAFSRKLALRPKIPAMFGLFGDALFAGPAMTDEMRAVYAPKKRSGTSRGAVGGFIFVAITIIRAASSGWSTSPPAPTEQQVSALKVNAMARIVDDALDKHDCNAADRGLDAISRLETRELDGPSRSLVSSLGVRKTMVCGKGTGTDH